MTALARIRTETPALPALRRTIRLRKSLTIVGALAPASLLAALVALGARTLRRREIVHVEILSSRTSYDLVPVYRLDVAEIVVVEHTDASVENICEFEDTVFKSHRQLAKWVNLNVS